MKRTTLAVMAALLLLIPASVSMAVEAPDDVPDGMAWDPVKERLIKDPLKVDARFIAKRTGRPYREVLAQLRTQERLDKPLARLERDPDYAGAFWAGGKALVVQFKDDVPGRAMKNLRAKSLVPVRGKVVEHSMRDLERFQRQVMVGLEAAGIEDWTAALDPQRQKVTATARATEPALREAARAEVARRVPAKVVSLSFTDGPLSRTYEAKRQPAMPHEVMADGIGLTPVEGRAVSDLVRRLNSLPGLIWPDAQVPTSLAEFLPAAREQLWSQANDALRLPLHLRFVAARCSSDGEKVTLVFEELRPPYLTRTYAYVARRAMPTSVDDGWSGGYGMSSVADDPEFVRIMGSDTVACP